MKKVAKIATFFQNSKYLSKTYSLNDFDQNFL